MKTRSSVLLVVLAYACMVGQGCRQLDTQVPSVNVVGSHQTASILGAVVQLRNPDNFSECKEQKEPVILKDVQFSGEFGGFHAGKFVAHDWITSPGGGLEVQGTVENVTIDGTCVDLLQKAFTNGCLVTKDYGRIPIAFAQTSTSTSMVYRCALAFSDEQLAKLKTQLAQGSKGGVHQSETSSAEPNKVSEDTARKLADPQH